MTWNSLLLEAPPTLGQPSVLIKTDLLQADLLQADVSPLTASSLLPAALPVHTENLVLAQQFDQDILGDMNGAFAHFVESGQVWALLIGFVLGYIFKSLTSYG